MTRPHPQSPARLGLWTKAKRNELDGAGCLVILGSLLLLPAVLISWGTAVGLIHEAIVTLKNLRWSDVPGLLHGFWQWLRGGSGGTRLPPLAVGFLAGYFFLLSQWISFLLDWHPRLPSPRVWAVSSLFFLASIVAFGFSTWPTDQPATDPAEYENSYFVLHETFGEKHLFGVWLIKTLAFSIIPGAFLAISFPLWLLHPRTRSKMAKPPESAPAD